MPGYAGKGGFGLQRISSEEAAALIPAFQIRGRRQLTPKSDAKKPPVAPPPKSNKQQR